MKKFAFIILAAAAIVFTSCTKEKFTEESNGTKPQPEGSIITFSTTIDLGPRTKATLDGLNIKWTDGDYVGIAADNSAAIVAYPVEDISEDGLSCTIKVNAVEGATKYYAIFKGRLGAAGDATNEVAADDFSAISFDTATKTFSGLTVGNQQVASGSLSSYLWYTNGYPLSMAGASNGNALVMKPCLALVKVQIAAESVPTDSYIVSETYTSTHNVDHDFSYSAVRGFNFYQKGSSTIYSSGNFTVQIGDDGDLAVAAVDNANKKEYRQISQTDKLTANTPYYMCLIPGSSASSFKIDFLGYKDDAGTINWDAVYTMTKSGITSVKPGDFYDLGTLNPLGRKMAKNHATADAEDVPFTPAIAINGDFSDWNEIEEYPGTRTNGGSNERIFGWRMTSDERNVYVYIDLNTAKFAGSGSYYKPNSYLYVCFDTDNSDATGSTKTSIPGVDQYLTIYPCVEDSDPVSLIQGIDPRSTINSSSDGTIMTWGVFDSVNTSHAYVELCIPRSKLGLNTANQTIKIGISFQDYDAAKQSITLK